MDGDRTEGDVNLSERRRIWQGENLSTRQAKLLKRDESAFFKQSLSSPCLLPIARAEGSRLYAEDGRSWLDFHGNGAHLIGHGHPHVKARVVQAMNELPFCPRRFTNRWAVEFAEKLVTKLPFEASRVLLAPGGAEAMSMALKLARVVTGRYKTISFWGSFHGATLDTISIGGEELFRQGMEPLLPGALHVGPPGWKHCAHGCGGLCRNRCLGELALLMEREGDIAAVVAEPVRCTTVEEPPEGYWRSVRELCDRHSALLIMDEIPLSFGRTGDWTACDTYGVEPDILVLGKGLGAGVFPLACMAARIEYDRFGHVALGHFTHEKTPLGCAAGLALLEVLEAEHLVSRSDALGRKFRQRLLSDLAQNRGVRAVRGTGLLTGVELEAGNRTADACEEILYGCLSDGLSFKVSDGRVLTLTPPLNILESELDEAAQIVASNVKKALGST